MYVIVAGAGLIGTETTRSLTANNHDVVTIDLDRTVCETVQAETGAMTIHGSATNIEVLENAGARKADIIVCVMHNDADNIACSLLAKSLGVPRIIARLRNPHYEQAYQLAGVTSIVRMADLLLNQIIMEVEQPRVRKIMVLGGGKAGIYAVVLPPAARVVGKAVREITREKKFPRDCVFMGIYRKEEDTFLIPRGDYVMQGGDTVFIISTSQSIKPATDFLTR